MLTAGIPFEELDLGNLVQGQHITVRGVRLVRADVLAKMKAFGAPGLDLLIICKDIKGQTLVSINGDLSHGLLLVSNRHKGIGYWMPQAEWASLPWAKRPVNIIDLDGQEFVRLDLDERIVSLAQSRHLCVVGHWHGFRLMAENGVTTQGLLMVDHATIAHGYWMPREEYLQHGAQTSLP